MKHSKWISVILVGAYVLTLMAGCGVKGNNAPPQSTSQQQGDTRMNDKVYEGSILSGIVNASTDGEIAVLAAKEETAEDGGEVAIMPAPGSDKEDNTTKVLYDKNCKFQIVKMDGAQKNDPEYQDASAEDVKNGSNVIIFGQELSSGEVKAEKIIIAEIYNKDKIPGSY